MQKRLYSYSIDHVFAKIGKSDNILPENIYCPWPESYSTWLKEPIKRQRNRA